jgi:hypothetical protein
MKSKGFILMALIVAAAFRPATVSPQDVAAGLRGELKGYVFEKGTGLIIPVATVAIPGTSYGAVTNEYGFFSIWKVPPGTYDLVVRCLGYEEYKQKVVVTQKQVQSLVIQLSKADVALEEITITANRKLWERMTPIGHQRMTVESMNRTPTLGVQSDLAQVLQTLPGVIFTGDRGGQLYVRGGAPIHNKVLLDGMTIINPFHSIGFMSVFDTETIQSVDVYSAAYGAQYGGRVSSVMDIRTRPGNRSATRGTVSQSNIGYGAMVEGPLKKATDSTPGSISYILSTKGSILRSSAPLLYPWLDSLGLPYRYNDFYGKVSFMERNGNQFDVFGLHYTDAVKYKNAITSEWTTTGGGFGLVMSPSQSNFLFINRLAMSRYAADFDDPSTTPKNTIYDNLDFSLKGVHMMDRFEFTWSAEFSSVHTRYAYLRWDGMHLSDDLYTSDAIILFQGKILWPKWILEPGLHLRVYSAIFTLMPEPRIKARYNISENLSLNLAAGLFSQNLSATMSEQDVVSVFQGFNTGIETVQDYFHGKRIYKPTQQAWHAVAGLSWFDKQNLKLSVEAYVKDFYRLINYNQHQLYSYLGYDPDYPEYLSSPYIYETGWAYGIDFLFDYANADYSFWMAYSFAYVTREDEFMKYVPHFDRRHNLNLLASYRFGEGRGWTVKSRWQIGSGFPFTQNAGFYEEFTNEDGTFWLLPGAQGDLAILYGPVNGGRLPAYHRLDLSLNRIWKLGGGRQLEASASVLNVYNRKNVFYYDRINQTRVNQLPIMPSLGIVLRF